MSAFRPLMLTLDEGAFEDPTMPLSTFEVWVFSVTDTADPLG